MGPERAGGSVSVRLPNCLLRLRLPVQRVATHSGAGSRLRSDTATSHSLVVPYVRFSLMHPSPPVSSSLLRRFSFFPSYPHVFTFLRNDAGGVLFLASFSSSFFLYPPLPSSLLRSLTSAEASENVLEM